MSELAFLPQPGLIFTLASFIAMIAVLVVVHEGGHYLAGRLFGTRIEAFGVGFGDAVVLTVPAADILLAAPADEAIKSKLGFSEISSIGSGNSKPNT